MRKLLSIGAVSALALLGVAACDSNPARASTPEGMCAYLVGNGNQNGGNRTVNKVVWPTQNFDYSGDYDMARYFPCGPRNYNVSPDSPDKDAGGQILLQSRTANNTPVYVDLIVWWMPNLKETALRQFITLCQKYECSNDNPSPDSNGNFANTGWNGMLRENFHVALEQLVKRNTNLVSDDVWLKEDMGLRDQLAAAIAAGWNAEFAKVSGATEDLICGSTNSDTPNNFDCQQVRVQVSRVYPVSQQLADSNSAAIAAQRQTEIAAQQAQARIAATDALYGPDLGRLARFCEDHPQAICSPGGYALQVNR